MGVSSSYRVWIYILNGVLICLQTAFVYAFCFIWIKPRFKLFPLDTVEVLATSTLVSIALQLFTCCWGILGVYFSNRCVIKAYWHLTPLLIIVDTVHIILWVHAFASLHENYEANLSRVFEKHLLSNGSNEKLKWMLCREWLLVQEEFNCCVPVVVLRNCQDFRECSSAMVSGCHFSLLRWLHSNVDGLAIFLYFIIYPIKWITVCVLREDINELFNEIFYADNPNLYNRHWLVIEQQETDDSQLSSPNDSSLAGKENRNGRIL